MRINLFFLAPIVLLAACERAPVMEARLEGEGIVALYEERNGPPTHWVIEDDWHSVFMMVRAGPERLRLFVRTYDDSTAARPDVWWSEGARPMKLDVTTVCDFEVTYFNEPGNSFAINFLKAGNPEIYPYYSPETQIPGLSAILEVPDCVGADIRISISVLDESGEPARKHPLSIQVEQVDWYYNPLFP